MRRRGDLTIWFTEEAIDKWHPNKVPGKLGRPQKYSDFAIECCLMLRQIYKLPLRQTEGFIDSLFSAQNIETYYNRKRLHSTNDYLAPEVLEKLEKIQ